MNETSIDDDEAAFVDVNMHTFREKLGMVISLFQKRETRMIAIGVTCIVLILLLIVGIFVYVLHLRRDRAHVDRRRLGGVTGPFSNLGSLGTIAWSTARNIGNILNRDLTDEDEDRIMERHASARNPFRNDDRRNSHMQSFSGEFITMSELSNTGSVSTITCNTSRAVTDTVLATPIMSTNETKCMKDPLCNSDTLAMGATSTAVTYTVLTKPIMSIHETTPILPKKVAKTVKDPLGNYDTLPLLLHRPVGDASCNNEEHHDNGDLPLYANAKTPVI